VVRHNEEGQVVYKADANALYALPAALGSAQARALSLFGGPPAEYAMAMNLPSSPGPEYALITDTGASPPHLL